MTSGGIRSAATARSASRRADRDQHRPAGLALPRGPQHGSQVGAVRLDERGHGLGTDPDHARRPEQQRGRVAAPRRWPARRRGPSGRPGPCSAGAGEPWIASLPTSALATAPSVSGRHDDDRQRSTRPGDVDETPHARLALGVGERALGGRGQDHGGDGHGRPMLAGGPGSSGAVRARCPTLRPHARHPNPSRRCATSRSSPTSITARPPSSTRCSARPAPSARIRLLSIA